MTEELRSSFYSLPREIRQHYVWKIDRISSINAHDAYIVIHRMDGCVDIWALVSGRWEITEKAA
jgi:hypothetical protein